MNKLENIDKILIKTAAQDKTGFGEKILCLSVAQNWKEIAGNIADRTAPIKIHEKILFISAENPAVKDSAKFLSKIIVENVNKIVGRGEKIISGIDFGKFFESPPKVPPKIPAQEPEKNIFSEENLEKIILTDEEISECEKKSAGIENEEQRKNLTEIFLSRKKTEKLKLQNGWHKCKICGELCEPEKIICSFCEINERDKMRQRIRKIFYDEPSTTFHKAQDKIFQEMPHMKKECTLSVIESERSSLIRETAARVSFGDKNSDNAKFLVMLLKQVNEKDLTDALIDRAFKELRFNLADRNLSEKS